MDFPLYNETYNYFSDQIPLNGNVLDLGCGPGNITNYLFRKRNDLNISGIDISDKMIILAKKNNPECIFNVSDLRHFKTQHEYLNGIIMGFCLPYIPFIDIKNLFPKLFDSLKNGGILYLSIVEGNPNDSGIKIGKDGRELYFFYHSITDISQLLLMNNLKIQKIFNIDYQNNDQSFDNHVVIISKK
ncbi:class I SAM-dependent methyltransferase [Leptospira venezuelensis]|uniref:class I SAM-dependent methyltransferase n=1 Tax=Leptospira venezuelensis TaxID=1958811 RepID=UPI0012FFCE27|nr:class I SAM-dependent methyltransferase [Leptospira venezuelensis]